MIWVYLLPVLLFTSMKDFVQSSQVSRGHGDPEHESWETESDTRFNNPSLSDSTLPHRPKGFCPVGQFECAMDHRLCVPQSANCNGKPDCPDESDEANCKDHHGSRLYDWMFRKRPDEDAEQNSDRCKYSISEGTEEESDLVLLPGTSPAPASTSDQQPTASVEKDCICAGEKLFCQNLHLPHLHGVPNIVEFLDLSGTRVDALDFHANTFPYLHSLILTSCSIEEIQPGTFSQLPSLQNLHLTGNILTTLPANAFMDNDHLHSLFLGYNRLHLIHSDAFQGLGSLEELDLRNNRLTGKESRVYVPLKKLLILHLNHNEIKVVTRLHLTGLEKLETLSLSSNFITTIEPNAFELLTNLKQLYLSWNHLHALEDRTFCNLRSLLSLNLNDNGIQRIAPDAFACLDHLRSLNLERNRFGELEHPNAIFDNLTQLQHIYFDQFWMCWWAPRVRSCEPKGDGISSVENLLDNIVLRLCVWIMGIVGVFGNLFVIVSRMVLREPNRVHSFYIRNLAGSDLLMGLFLLSIAIHDVSFRGEFLARQHAWRHSLTCQLSGLMCTLSSESSVFILTLITLDRYISIVRPFAEKSTSVQMAVGICFCLWLVSFILSYLPLSGFFFGYFGSDFYTGNGLCLPLHIHNPYDPGWEYSFVLFVLLNSIAFIFICFAYGRMLRIIQSSSLMIRSTQEKQDSLLAKRFALVVVTDFLCWAPVIGAKVTAMAGVQIPSDLYGWLAVFVLPVNSALNPIIYTLTTKLFKQQLARMTSVFRKRLAARGQLDESTASFSAFRRDRTTRRTTLTTSINPSSRKDSHRIHNQVQMQIIIPSHSNGQAAGQIINPKKMSEVLNTLT